MPVVAGACEKSECFGSERKDGSFILTIGKGETAIPVISLGAKVLRCSRVLKKADFWAVEIDLGEAGTSTVRRETDLFVFSLRGEKVDKIFQRNIETSVASTDKKTGKIIERVQKKGYHFLRSENGEPQVRFDGEEPETLKP